MFLQELRSPQKVIIDINMVDEPDCEAELEWQNNQYEKVPAAVVDLTRMAV